MESLKVIKKLGSGVIGTTYLVLIKNKQYVCKIEKILEEDIQYDTSKSLWREIEFSKFASQYPNHFMQLKSWEIVSGCEHVQPPPPPFIKGKHRKFLINKNKSDYCSKLLYSPVLDGTLNDFYKEINKKPNNNKFYSMICQCTYSISLLISNGYIHRDLHPWNIMYKKTTAKTIKLGNITVPTYGLQWFLIDYGLILHKDFDRSTDAKDKKQEISQLKNKYVDLAIFYFNSIEMPIWDLVQKDKLKVTEFKKLVGKIKASTEYKNIAKFIPTINEKEVVDMCIAQMFLLFYPVKYHEFMGIDVDKYKKYIIIYDDDLKNLYKYMLKNIDKPTNIIKRIKDTYLN